MCIISRLLEFTMFACIDASLKNVCTVSLGITYTAYHILGRKQTISLR